MTPRPRTRLIGVDTGTVRVGLSVCDADRRIASPLATYPRRDAAADARYFNQLAAAEEAAGFVVGLPVHLDGREGVKAVEARAFGKWLTEVTGLPVVFYDERFTTREAESALWGAGLTHRRRKERRDRVAAQILLQAYLEAGCPPEEPPRGLDEPAESD